jgi:hypothetical protein
MGFKIGPIRNYRFGCVGKYLILLSRQIGKVTTVSVLGDGGLEGSLFISDIFF